MDATARSAGSLAARAAAAFLIVEWVFVAGVAVMVFLAGLGVFSSGLAFATHRDLGYVLGLVPLVLVVLGLIARLPRRLVGAAVLLFGLFMLQSVFVILRTSLPMVAALHPLNGFLILLVGIWLGLAARAFVPRPLGTAS